MIDTLYKIVVEPTRDPALLQRQCWAFSAVLVTWTAWGSWSDGGVWATLIAVVAVS